MRCLNKGTQHKLNSGDETFFVCYLLALFATSHFFLKVFPEYIYPDNREGKKIEEEKKYKRRENRTFI